AGVQSALDRDQAWEVTARHIEREPDYGAIPASTPPRLVRLLRRCLAKDPRQRLRDCGDARLELQEIGSPDVGVDVIAGSRSVPWLVLGVLGGAAGVAASLAVAGFFVRPDPRPPTRFTIVLPGSQVLQAGAYQSVAISPAATDLAYIADNRVYVRALGELEARPVAGTEDQGPLGGVLFS